MKGLRKILIYVLVIDILGGCWMVPLIHLDFELRKDYIAEVLCINRDEPITVCGGKCFLNGQLEKATEQQNEDTQTTNRIVEIQFFNQQHEIADLSYSVLRNGTDYPTLNSSNTISSFIGEVFKPPRLV